MAGQQSPDGCGSMEINLKDIAATNCIENSNETTDVEEGKAVEIHHWYSIDPLMAPSKVSVFFSYATVGCVLQYWTLFYVSIGLDSSQAGLICGIQLFGSLAGGPFWGFIADRNLWHQTISKMLCIVSIFIICLIPFISLFLGDCDKNTCPIKLNNTITNISFTVVDNKSNTNLFHVLLGVPILGYFFAGSIDAFVSSGILRAIQKSPRKSDIGRQNSLGPAGYAVGGIISGYAIDHFPDLHISCYTGMFMVYAVSATGMAIGFHFLFKDKIESSASTNHNKNINQTLLCSLRRYETCLFFTIVLFHGIGVYIETSFSFLFLTELGASHSLRGCSMAVSCISTSFFFMISQKIIDLLGTLSVMAIGYLFLVIRYICLSNMTTPFAILGINAIYGISYSIFLCAIMQYTKDKFPPSIYTVISGIVLCLYNGGGGIIANVVGGKIYMKFGGRKLFMFCSIGCTIWTIITLIYAIVDKYRKKQTVKNEIGDNVLNNCHGMDNNALSNFHEDGSVVISNSRGIGDNGVFISYDNINI